MCDQDYRQHLKDHFMDKILQKKIRPDLKDKTQKSQHQFHGLETPINEKQKKNYDIPTSGGDADRMLYHYKYAALYGGDSCRMHGTSDSLSLKRTEVNSNPSPANFTLNANRALRTYSTAPIIDDLIGDNLYLHVNDSSSGNRGNESEGSANSQKSSKTVVSRKSSHDLRKLITSQCKLHDVVGETIKEMCNTDAEKIDENNVLCGPQEEKPFEYPLTLSQCKRCCARLQTVQSQKDVMTGMGKSDFLDCHNNTTLTISVDDVISSRVVNPMIHKLHRMYLNNLKEEMSLMEDLERLPSKVNELYKSVIFKQKD